MLSLRRLVELPAVITREMLTLNSGEFDSLANFEARKKFLARAVKNSLLAAAGLRTGVYFNLVVDPAGPSRRILEAVAVKYPDAVVVGASAINSEGLLVDPPSVIEVAIRASLRTTCSFHGVGFVRRPDDWFDDLGQRGLRVDFQEEFFPLRSLRPRAAWIDMCIAGDLKIPPSHQIDEWLSSLGGNLSETLSRDALSS